MSNTTDAIADYDTYGPYTNDLRGYRGIFASNPFIADAMGYTALPSDVKSALWAAFDAAETNDGVANVNDPVDMPANQHAGYNGSNADNDVTYTWAEARASYVAKVAHAFYLEHHRVYPWTISSYDLESCEGLFDPAELFWTWTPSTSATQWKICDASPSRAYGVASAIVGTPRSPLAAVASLVYHGSEFRHSAANPQPGWSPNNHPAVICAVEEATAVGTDGVGNSYSTGSPYFISRAGCHFMSVYQAALARAINIPSKDSHGWWYPDAGDPVGRPTTEDGLSHHSNWYPSLRARPGAISAAYPITSTAKGLVLSHGDDPYPLGGVASPISEEARAVQRMVPKAFYDDHILGQTPIAKRRASNAMRHAYNAERPATLLDEHRDSGGWSMTHAFVSGLDASDMDKICSYRRSLDGAALGRVKDSTYYTDLVWQVGYPSRNGNTTGVSGSLSKPTGVVDGDLLIFVYINNDVTASVASVLPSGFTHVSGSPMSSCGNTLLTVAYKIASSEPSLYNYGALSPSAGNPHSAMLVAFRNVDQTNPIGEIATACDTSTAANALIDAPIIAPTDDEFFQLIIAGKNNNDLGTDFLEGSTNIPYMGFLYDYYAGAPTEGASLIGVAGYRDASHKTTATQVKMGNAARNGDGVPYMSIQIRGVNSAEIPTGFVRGDTGLGGIVSDDFNAATLNGTPPAGMASVWTETLNSATASIQGYPSSDVFYRMVIPDINRTTAAWNVPRISQATTNVDFTIEAGFKTWPGDALNQTMAVGASQADITDGETIWTEARTTGVPGLFAVTLYDGGAKIGDAFIDAPTTSLGLRLTRSGNIWSTAYSLDGADFVTGTTSDDLGTKTITQVHTWAGNTGGSGTWNFDLDYFWETSAAITNED